VRAPLCDENKTALPLGLCSTRHKSGFLNFLDGVHHSNHSLLVSGTHLYNGQHLASVEMSIHNVIIRVLKSGIIYPTHVNGYYIFPLLTSIPTNANDSHNFRGRGPR
jgi:hypothetical protein